MRKAIIIKANTILLAWLVIFIHSVIPHKHLQDNYTGCHELFHETIPGYNDCDITLKFEDQPGAEYVCHFSNFLFHQFSQDNLIISSNKGGHFYPIRLTGLIVIHPTKLFISHPYHGTSSLRAPPAV